MTPHGESTHSDIYILRDVHVDVAKANKHRQRGSHAMYVGLAKIEIYIAECSHGDRPAAEFDPSTFDDFAQQGAGEMGGAALRRDRRQPPAGREPELNLLKICLNSGRMNLVNSLGELLEREPPGQQVVPQPRHRLVALGIR